MILMAVPLIRAHGRKNSLRFSAAIFYCRNSHSILYQYVFVFYNTSSYLPRYFKYLLLWKTYIIICALHIKAKIMENNIRLLQSMTERYII